MRNAIFQANDFQIVQNNQSLEITLLINNFRNGIWLFGIPSWMFGIVDRSFVSIADGYLSAIEVLQLCTAFFLFVSWLCLKPEQGITSSNVNKIQSYKIDVNSDWDEAYIHAAQARMLELQNQHIIGQEYILPFPYICQIYHLLNLKHLETVHNFSLSNLKVIKVSDFQPTTIGGAIKFQTFLDSPINVLRIWRLPIVEVQLILHTPFTVELSIPVYNNKTITVIFNVLPLSNNEHKLFIDIYSNLEWPRPVLQILLHFASCLTLFEDLPYLRKLAERNTDRLVKSGRFSNRDTTWLFRRFVDLYGSSIKSLQPIRAIEVAEVDTSNLSR